MLNEDRKQTAPEEKTLINIVEKISSNDQVKIAEEICSQYQIDLDSRADWETKRERWYKLWACVREEKTSPWTGCSNVAIPMLAVAVNQFHARSYQSIFSPPGLVKTIPVGAADVKRAKNVESYMNWQAMYEMEEYEEVFDKLLQLLPINGTAFKKIYYSKDLDRPVSEYISALDIVLPYRTKSLETARRIVHRIWLHYDELEQRNEAGLYKNFEKVSSTPDSSSDDDEVKQTADDVVGEQPVASTEKPHLILECHKHYKVNGVYAPYIFTVDFSSKTLLRVVSREYTNKDGETTTLNYFIDYHFIPNPEGFYSFGFGHFLEPLNEMANTAFNQVFDSGRLTNNPFGFYGRRAGIKKRKVTLVPGVMTEVEDVSQIHFPSMQRVDSVLFNILGLIQQYAEQFTSTSDYLTGRESAQTKTPTASGTLAIIEQGLVTFAVMTKRIFRSLKKELRLMMKFNQIFLPDTKEYRVMESEENIAFPDIKRDDFGGVKDIIPIGDPSYASKFSRRQEAMEVYNLMMANPLVTGTPPGPMGESTIPPNVKAMYALASNLLDSYDIKDKSKILPELPPESVSPVMENAMFMQGDYKAPISGENHVEHMQVHIRFMSQDFFKMMNEDYKLLLIQHIEETKQVEYTDSMQQQQLGAPSEGVPPTGSSPKEIPSEGIM